jgi:Alkylmercury lyase
MTSERMIPLAREKIDPFLRGVQVRAFFALLETGEPVPIERVGPADRLPEVRAAVHGLLERGRMTTTAERVTGSLGLTVRETPHRLELAEGVRYTWCALDAIGILPALDRTGLVVSAVPDTTENVRIEFDAGRVRIAPSGLALLVPGAPTGPVVLTWCPLANFFPTEEQARIWADRHGIEDFTVIDLPEAIDQAAPLWRTVLTGNPGEGQ